MPTNMEPLSSWIAEAARDMESRPDTDTTLAAAVRLAVRNIDGAEAAGVSVNTKAGVATTPAWEGQMALDNDLLQYDLGEGPCLTSIDERGTVLSRSVASDPRWPRWGPEASRRFGAESVLSVWLYAAGGSLGALNMYSSTKDAFSEEDVAESLALAAHVAIAFAAARKADALMAGLDSRSVIGQAMGILMERYDLTPTVAFDLLGRLSASGEVKLRVLAAQIVSTRELPTTPTH